MAPTGISSSVSVFVRRDFCERKAVANRVMYILNDIVRKNYISLEKLHLGATAGATGRGGTISLQKLHLGVAAKATGRGGGPRGAIRT